MYYIDKPTSVKPEKLNLTAPTAKETVKAKKEASKSRIQASKPPSATPEQEARKICETLHSFSTLRFTMAKYAEEDLLEDGFVENMRFFWHQENFSTSEPALQGNSLFLFSFS